MKVILSFTGYQSDNYMCLNNVDDLMTLVDDGEADEVQAIGVIEYIDPEKADKLLQILVKKVALNGIFVLSIGNLKQVARSLVLGELNMDQANDLIYGRSPLFKRFSIETTKIMDILKSLGLTIEATKVDLFTTYITCSRRA